VVWDLGFRVSDFGCRVWTLGFRVLGYQFWVSSFQFRNRVWGSGLGF